MSKFSLPKFVKRSVVTQFLAVSDGRPVSDWISARIGRRDFGTTKITFDSEIGLNNFLSPTVNLSWRVQYISTGSIIQHLA